MGGRSVVATGKTMGRCIDLQRRISDHTRRQSRTALMADRANSKKHAPMPDNVTKFQLSCYSSSSAAAFPPPTSVTNAVRKLVKTRVLDEMTKADSSMWDNASLSSNNDFNDKNASVLRETLLSSSHPQPWVSDVAGETGRSVNGVNGHHAGLNGNASVEDINTPTQRNVLYQDSLDEWFLPGDINTTAPPFAPSNQNKNNFNENNRITLTVPDGVRPLHEAHPFELSKVEISTLAQGIRNDLIGTEHPVLHRAASYFFDPSGSTGKMIRPTMVMLLSKALDSHYNLNQKHSRRGDLLQAQRRLAQISELIHTASLFHDDVIDEAETRRDLPTSHMVFGNKMSILAGDYLLARASIFLARLRDVDVVETMSTIIEHLVRGEVMQMKVPQSGKEEDGTGKRKSQHMNGSSSHAMSEAIRLQMEYYLRKNYYKTASLMAHSCKSAALLGHYPSHLVQASYQYGKHMGLAFQLVDDVLDFDVGRSSETGKTALSDLKAGIATAPVLIAAGTHPELKVLMARKFEAKGDVELAAELVMDKSDGIERTMDMARLHAQVAMNEVMGWKVEVDCPYRDALVHLALMVVNRTR